ncbi:hypothetical protein HPP92_014537 [Vanilla planifolia]|uniref:Uncharacterized protein n=1 Tax=Vanilla planifolia TaxID=51239 RepID=A0A835QLP3_VANPL|nr:hypothetical protein HPP92_014537 [Vanilla planifolia]
MSFSFSFDCFSQPALPKREKRNCRIPCCASAMLFLFPSFSTGGAPLSNPSIWQPPLLPLPRSATLPAPTNWIEAATAATAFRYRRQHSKRKAKSFIGARKDNLGKRKEEGKPATVAIEFSSPRSTKVSMVNEVSKLAAGAVSYDDLLEDEVYSLSPPPSSLPFPKFSLTKQKVSGTGIAAGSCTAEAVMAAGAVDSGADDLRCALRI